ncbi:preprotein translocase subunit SecY [Spiroplasma clarkii]|uniref:Protein translocase subunit SecY n=1 Tax=Spiroplasma clarkii TaxID=2139 RepID=A0A1Y0L062_9MOLU|nr:preprotein translocase subunit SecY [Spiroplasma clarkii]ARU91098.1 preprotein translocase subunit SecY [Spiroplasma clarkii]ATX70539.1 preprotein translocase subunit SecY [Spiroplasma clarkii]
MAKLKQSKATSKTKEKNEFARGNFFVRNKDLVKRIVFTLIVLVIIRAGTLLTVPGIELSESFKAGVDNQEFFQLLATLGGGTIGQFSILALGVSPYITASIIVQLLSTDVIPVLTRWNKSGERGRRKLDKLTKALTVPFAIMQSIATIFTLSTSGLISPKWGSSAAGSGPAWFYYILVPTVMLGGTFLMLWVADQITIRGIGNGVSIIIFTGIVSSMPTNFVNTFKFWIKQGEDPTILFDGVLKFLIYIVAFVFVIFIVVLMNEAERKVPIQQTGSGLVDAKDHTPYLPLKLNNAGVIPVIFASAIISTPMTVAQIVGENSAFSQFTQNYLSFSTWWGIGIYGVLTVLFTFLYAQVQINPEKIAEDFKKSGTFIPGIKPGKDTEKFLQGTINRLSVIGAIFLAGIAVLPYIISKVTNLPSSLAIGGTGLVIIISVAIQTVQQLKGRLIQQSFIDKKQEKFADANEKTNSHIW